ncbi:hypothetical protein, partial [Mycoplasmopsis bovis]|uniref:hypothetical protein n=1 Tax=Mycoplasmopsis bovis TaxID=28903 RepID=UPI003D28D25D
PRTIPYRIQNKISALKILLKPIKCKIVDVTKNKLMHNLEIASSITVKRKGFSKRALMFVKKLLLSFLFSVLSISKPVVFVTGFNSLWRVYIVAKN